MLRHPVFVVGSPRSGTSALVDVLLAAGYSGFREGMLLSLMHGLDQQVERHFKVFTQPSDQVLISRVDKDDLKDRLFRVFREVAEAHNGAAPWFDKTGNHDMILAIPVLRRLWPGSVFVFARRRGIENIVSRVRKFPGHGFEYHCRDWARTMWAWRQVRGGLPEDARAEVDQQDMIGRPEAVADRLCAFLGLPPERQAALVRTMRQNRPQQTEAGTAARRLTLETAGWDAAQAELFRLHCASEMAAYGYTTDEGYSTAPA